MENVHTNKFHYFLHLWTLIFSAISTSILAQESNDIVQYKYQSFYIFLVLKYYFASFGGTVEIKAKINSAKSISSILSWTIFFLLWRNSQDISMTEADQKLQFLFLINKVINKISV